MRQSPELKNLQDQSCNKRNLPLYSSFVKTSNKVDFYSSSAVKDSLAAYSAIRFKTSGTLSKAKEVNRINLPPNWQRPYYKLPSPNAPKTYTFERELESETRESASSQSLLPALRDESLVSTLQATHYRKLLASPEESKLDKPQSAFQRTSPKSLKSDPDVCPLTYSLPILKTPDCSNLLVKNVQEQLNLEKDRFRARIGDGNRIILCTAERGADERLYLSLQDARRSKTLTHFLLSCGSFAEGISGVFTFPELQPKALELIVKYLAAGPHDGARIPLETAEYLPWIIDILTGALYFGISALIELASGVAAKYLTSISNVENLEPKTLRCILLKASLPELAYCSTKKELDADQLSATWRRTTSILAVEVQESGMHSLACVTLWLNYCVSQLLHIFSKISKVELPARLSLQSAVGTIIGCDCRLSSPMRKYKTLFAQFDSLLGQLELVLVSFGDRVKNLELRLPGNSLKDQRDSAVSDDDLDVLSDSTEHDTEHQALLKIMLKKLLIATTVMLPSLDTVTVRCDSLTKFIMRFVVQPTLSYHIDRSKLLPLQVCVKGSSAEILKLESALKIAVEPKSCARDALASNWHSLRVKKIDFDAVRVAVLAAQVPVLSVHYELMYQHQCSCQSSDCGASPLNFLVSKAARAMLNVNLERFTCNAANCSWSLSSRSENGAVDSRSIPCAILEVSRRVELCGLSFCQKVLSCINYRNLTSLAFVQVKAETRDWQKLFECLTGCQSLELKVLKIESSFNSAHDVNADSEAFVVSKLLSALFSCPTCVIEELSLRECKLNSAECLNFIKGCNKSGTLKSLDLSGISLIMVFDEVIKLITSHGTIESYSISNCELQPRHFKALFNALLFKDQVDGFKWLSRLKSLDVSMNAINDSLLAHLLSFSDSVMRYPKSSFKSFSIANSTESMGRELLSDKALAKILTILCESAMEVKSGRLLCTHRLHLLDISNHKLGTAAFGALERLLEARVIQRICISVDFVDKGCPILEWTLFKKAAALHNSWQTSTSSLPNTALPVTLQILTPAKASIFREIQLAAAEYLNINVLVKHAL